MCLPFSDLAERTLGKGEHLGFEWEIVNAHGHRCGYVRVLPGHPWFGRSYSCAGHYDEPPDPNHVCNDFEASVHGGITFADYGKACPTHGAAEEWWVGFDTAHYNDKDDPELATDKPRHDSLYADGIIWTQDMVIDECRNLCEQAARA